jgi:vacuolar-type H+-ATPase subunit H
MRSPAHRAADGVPATIDVDEAMRAVLAAEAAAEASVRAAEREAEGQRECARADARSIAARVERRIVALRHGFEELTRHAVAALDAAVAQDASGAPSPLDREVVGLSAAAVAAELTGGDP